MLYCATTPAEMTLQAARRIGMAGLHLKIGTVHMAVLGMVMMLVSVNGGLGTGVGAMGVAVCETVATGRGVTNKVGVTGSGKGMAGVTVGSVGIGLGIALTAT
jgi:hypothetical protein